MHGLLFLLVGSSHAQAKDDFSAAERVKLERGELVVRQRQERRGPLHLVGGTSFQLMDASPEVVWSTVMNTREYRHFIPFLHRARIVRETRTTRRIQVRHQKGPLVVGYTLDVSYNRFGRAAQFRVDTEAPSDLRAGWGFFSVRRYDDRRTIITYGIMADVGGGVISGILRPQVHEWMMRIPNELRRYLQSTSPQVSSQTANFNR